MHKFAVDTIKGPITFRHSPGPCDVYRINASVKGLSRFCILNLAGMFLCTRASRTVVLAEPIRWPFSFTGNLPFPLRLPERTQPDRTYQTGQTVLTTEVLGIASRRLAAGSIRYWTTGLV